ncbi:Fe-S protein assembly co-chaperone HscB [Variovorax dokdonensis]|uniref:Co-chaperone protein HscB homolog n=1 Tax=Variovorax dokdonensis TaxID=344883 RepID=A0ABT7N7X8_9BURK|nr:Fe-S protein assembly co-chaperone HscB [Variovorax dokdonensis]MDM0044053.1 Fe-S protein assembly co-chaperone HscB [Variovorax dokdonensis]
MKLDATDFELFDVPATFAQDRAVLDARWKELLREAHPDRVAAQGAVAQRVAMQWSVRINEAYQRLKDPIKRAAYLCRLNGVTIDAEHNTAMPTDFLMQQMAWREQLDETGDAAGLQALQDEVDDARRRGLSSLDWLIDEKGDFAQAAAQVRALMFIERFGEDVEARLDRLGQ